MKEFLFAHKGGCSPVAPCVSCQVVGFLRKELSGKKFEKLMKMAGAGATKKTPHIGLDAPLGALGLRTKLYRALESTGVRSVRGLVSMGEEKLSLLRNIGPHGIVEIRAALARAGHTL